MLAIVLVGGFGTRMRPLTYSIPKPMLPVGHDPMIARLVGRLARGGVTDVVLALGFKPEPFQAAFPDGVCHTEHGDVTMHYAVADYYPAYRCMNRVTVVHDRRVPN